MERTANDGGADGRGNGFGFDARGGVVGGEGVGAAVAGRPPYQCDCVAAAGIGEVCE